MSKKSGRAFLVAIGVVVPIAVTGLGIPGTANAATSHRSVLRGSSPQWATPAHEVSAPGAASRQTVRVYLAPQHKAQLDQLAAAVSNPQSTQYRQFLTSKQYQARFGTTAAQVGAVKRWLGDAGLKVGAVGAANRYVEATGTTAATVRAFATPLRTYRHAGKVMQAPATDVTLPADLAGTVLGVSGLQTPQALKPTKNSAPPAPGFRNARPCSLWYGQITALYQADYRTPLPKFQGSYLPYSPCGYVPPQLRGAYGVTGSGLTGTGVTVAITDAYASPTIRGDANTYATGHGDAAFAPGQFTQSEPAQRYRRQKDCDPSGWYGEETLDVEAVHAMATGANVRYYAARSCYDDDLLETLGRVVDDNQASIVTNSWSGLEEGETAALINAYETVFEQGAVQGIGFFFSSGDSGDELAATGLKQVDYPSSDPWVTSVGGTSLAVDFNNNYMFETGWGTDKYTLSATGTSWTPLGFLYGAGGGTSMLFPRPAYQDGVVPASLGSGRAVPDVGLDADPTTGMLIGQTQTFPEGVAYGEYRIGGTSLASPLMAGMQALATQKAGGRLGFANPAIYQLAGSKAFTDVRPVPKAAGNVRVDYVNSLDPSAGLVYSVRTFGDDSSLTTTKGWDDVTGVGSPTARYLNDAGR
jgi:subtilase family serine protease